MNSKHYNLEHTRLYTSIPSGCRVVLVKSGAGVFTEYDMEHKRGRFVPCGSSGITAESMADAESQARASWALKGFALRQISFPA